MLRIVRVRITATVAFGPGHKAWVDQRTVASRLGEQHVKRYQWAWRFTDVVVKARISGHLCGNQLGFLLKMQTSGLSSFWVCILHTLPRGFSYTLNFNHWFVVIHSKMRWKEWGRWLLWSLRKDICSKPKTSCLTENAKEGLRTTTVETVSSPRQPRIFSRILRNN